MDDASSYRLRDFFGDVPDSVLLARFLMESYMLFSECIGDPCADAEIPWIMFRTQGDKLLRLSANTATVAYARRHGGEYETFLTAFAQFREVDDL